MFSFIAVRWGEFIKIYFKCLFYLILRLIAEVTSAWLWMPWKQKSFLQLASSLPRRVIERLNCLAAREGIPLASLQADGPKRAFCEVVNTALALGSRKFLCLLQLTCSNSSPSALAWTLGPSPPAFSPILFSIHSFLSSSSSFFWLSSFSLRYPRLWFSSWTAFLPCYIYATSIFLIFPLPCPFLSLLLHLLCPRLPALWLWVSSLPSSISSPLSIFFCLPFCHSPFPLLNFLLLPSSLPICSCTSILSFTCILLFRLVLFLLILVLPLLALLLHPHTP